MDIKDLNKSQLLLLAVLLSFITSIATGITTVTLMQQAPTSFTAPVNRVVRQTVEKIQQVEGKTVTQTVVIKEEDLVVDAIEKNKSAIFTITKEGQDANNNVAEISAGFGFGISTEGVVVTDATLVPGSGAYFVKNNSGKFKADFISKDPAGFSFLKIGIPVNGTDKLSLTVPTFGDLGKMKIGQKVLVFGGGISSFIFDGNKDIKANITKSNEGAIVLDLDGNVLGIALFQETASFVSIDVIANAVKPFLKDVTSMSATPILAPSTSTNAR